MPEWSSKQTKNNYDVNKKASDFSVGLSGLSATMFFLLCNLYKKNFIHT